MDKVQLMAFVAMKYDFILICHLYQNYWFYISLKKKDYGGVQIMFYFLLTEKRALLNSVCNNVFIF